MNYADFLTIQKKHKDVHIIAFPCNQFGRQEPGSEAEIRKFAQAKGLSLDSNFHLMAKVNVNGANIPDAWMALKEATDTVGSDTRWNFDTKFVAKCDDTECSVARLGSVGTMDALKQIVPEVLKAGSSDL